MEKATLFCWWKIKQKFSVGEKERNKKPEKNVRFLKEAKKRKSGPLPGMLRVNTVGKVKQGS
jgi:hypothetical protein